MEIIVNKAIANFSKHVNGRNVHKFNNKKCILLGLIELNKLTNNYNDIIQKEAYKFLQWIDREKNSSLYV